MIPGIISGYLQFTEHTYNDLRTKQSFRRLVLESDFGFDIDVFVSEELFSKYTTEIKQNGLNSCYKFVIDGEIKSPDARLQSENLTNLYIRAKEIYLDNESKVNLFYFNGFATRSMTEYGDYKKYKVAANKVIVNSREKRNKTTYADLKTKKNVFFEAKDVLQGSVKLIYEDTPNQGKEILLEAIYIEKNSESTEILKQNFIA